MSEQRKKYEVTSIESVLVVSDQLPSDFYTNKKYLEQLNDAIEKTTNLVYPLDDDGEKRAKADATSINKFVRTFDSFIALTYKQQTEEVQAWRDSLKSKTKQLLANRQKLIDQFEEKRQEKLSSIKDMLEAALLNEWTEKGVNQEFRKGIVDDFVKLTGTLTPNGALTKKAVEFIAAIANDDLTEQRRIESRKMHIENRCLREEINPPLTFAHFGEAFTADDDVFTAKMDELIGIEKQRRAELAERLIKQQEAEHQRKLNEALKAQQAEADRLAREKAYREQQEAVKESKQQEEPPVKETDEPRTTDTAQNGKRSVKVTATFVFHGISNRVSNNGVKEFFIKQLPEQLQAIMTSSESRND